MKLKKNWEIKSGFLKHLMNLWRKGGINPRFYIYRYRFNYPNKSKISPFPVDIIAELSNTCNLRCTMCFQSDPALPVRKTTKTHFMSMHTFSRIVDEGAKYGLPALKLSWRGESLMNPEFTEMIRYAKRKGILEVTSLTNGYFLDERTNKEIIDAKLDQLVISIDGFTKATYERIRVGSDFDRVISNLKNLLALRGKAKKPFIRLQFTASDINKHETTDFYEYWHNKVDEVSISYCKEFGSPDKENAQNAPIYTYCCPQLFQRLIVMTDGTVTVCATDVMGSISMGNVHQSSLKDIWHSRGLNDLRKQHLSGNYHLNPMCRICVSHLYQSNKKSGRL